MKKAVLDVEDLYDLGFVYQGKEYLDYRDFYEWWVIYKGDSELHITYDYDKHGVFQRGTIEFNGEQLKGRDIQKKDVELLIELM